MQSAHTQDPKPGIGKTVIRNVRVFDGTSMSELQTVVIDGKLIGRDPAGAQQIIDGEGGFLVPGLIDAHVHVHTNDHLQQLLKHGVTTALDMAMWPVEKMQRLRGQEDLPDLRTAGLPATKTGSLHSCILPLPQEAFLTSPEQAASWVERRIDEGSDYIKIIADVPGPDQVVMDAISAEAHQRGKMVVAHAASYNPFSMALEAKVDVVTHVACDKAVDTDLTDRMMANKTIAVPTLCMMKETTKTPSLSAAASLLLKPSALLAIIRGKSNTQGPANYNNARESVAALHMAGVPILAGTDCHEEPSSMFDVKHGESMHRELELLVEAGLSPVEAICAATSLPAKHFKLQDRGMVAEGKRADLVLLREDPTENIRATRSISRIWCNGREVGL